MWKRLNNQTGAQQPSFSISRDDENSYGGSHGLGIQAHSSTSPPVRPQREDMGSKGLPSLPFELAPPKPPSQSNSTFRPVSSIYSQPSPAPLITTFAPKSYTSPTSPPYSSPYGYGEDVSPPSSPEFDARQRGHISRNDHEVSPIEKEMPDISKLNTRRPESRNEQESKSASSNIPILRREKRRNQVAEAANNLVARKQVGGGNRPAKNPSWDPFTGEATTADKGRKQTTKPGEFTPPGLRSVYAQPGVRLGNDTSISAGVKKPESFGDRVRKLASNAPEPRPQWKGASGRVTLVSTPSDTLDVAPLNIPKRVPQRVVSPISEQPTPVSPAPKPRNFVETVPAPSYTDNNAQNSYTASPSSDERKGSPIFDAEIADHARGNRINRASPVETKHSPVSPVEEIVDKNYKIVAPPPPQSYVQPPSRFSVSTYATSEPRSTPRPSTDTFEPTYDHPPLPSPTPSFVSQSPESVLNRAKPKVGPGPDRSPSLMSDDSVLNRVRPKVGPNPRGGVMRKAVSTASPVFISMSKRASRTGKTLPITPAEVESQDLVSSLQAQLDDLQHRKHNITRSIRQMTELMPADNITLTNDVRRKRELEKKKVEGLREEEAEVTLQIRETGLRLHRAWKRKDKEAVYEPTGLWVRRVTG